MLKKKADSYSREKEILDSVFLNSVPIHVFVFLFISRNIKCDIAPFSINYVVASSY